MKIITGFCTLLLSLTIISSTCTVVLADDSADSETATTDDTQQAEREQKFEVSMENVTLVGFFTDSNAEDQELKEDRYTIESVTKGKNDYWVFRAQIQYGGRDVKMAMPLEVKWAGDTPMITLNNIPIPQLGTFSARVIFYDGRYAGTWSGTDHGGHMFGRIEKNEPAEKSAEEENAGTP